jgi:hypothetical protein
MRAIKVYRGCWIKLQFAKPKYEKWCVADKKSVAKQLKITNVTKVGTNFTLC